ncbi:24206_t:CDS:2 [Cetraspora pellucida]|uniref:24206_t:CDS:1 n=1 Tax=Cetraspora pellucida TaxID=1433469 RepID=A0A9N9E3U5_9GLOM|nr:24206_t:CDS:2 [Cetraspora pellucida]
MLPPASHQFTNYDKLLNYVRNFTRAQGYAITVKRTCSDKNDRIKNVLLKYNRGASINISEHPIVSRLDAGQLDQNDPSSIAISRMIYNSLYSICQERLNSRTPIQALLDELQGLDFKFEYKYNYQNYIKHLFFTHRLSIALTHTYSNETEADYKWALSYVSRIFNGISYPNVIVTDRELALISAISKIFPTTKQILCIWHINKNILAKCRHHFDTEEQ